MGAYDNQTGSLEDATAASIIWSAVLFIIFLASPCNTLCFLAALSVGSSQVVYWTVTSLISPIIYSFVGIRIGGEITSREFSLCKGGEREAILDRFLARGGLLVREESEISRWEACI